MQIKKNLNGLCFETSYNMIDEKIGTGLIGISLNNSYFTAEKINELIITASNEFKDITIFIPDTLAIHNYKAIGIDSIKAEKLARLNGNNIENRCKKTIDNLLNKPTIIKWDEIEKSTAYHDQLKTIVHLYETNIEFKRDARENTRHVLGSKISAIDDIDKAIDAGVNYILKEIAFFLAGPDMLNCPKIAFIYHKEWVLFQNFLNGKYDNLKKENVGFMIIS